MANHTKWYRKKKEAWQTIQYNTTCSQTSDYQTAETSEKPARIKNNTIICTTRRSQRWAYPSILCDLGELTLYHRVWMLCPVVMTDLCKCLQSLLSLSHTHTHSSQQVTQSCCFSLLPRLLWYISVINGVAGIRRAGVRRRRPPRGDYEPGLSMHHRTALSPRLPPPSSLPLPAASPASTILVSLSKHSLLVSACLSSTTSPGPSTVTLTSLKLRRPWALLIAFLIFPIIQLAGPNPSPD